MFKVRFVYLNGTIIKREGKEKNLHSLFHCPNVNNGECWAKQKPGDFSFFWVSYMSAAAQALGPSSTAFPGIVSRELDWKLEQPGHQPIYIHDGGTVGGTVRHCWPQCVFPPNVSLIRSKLVVVNNPTNDNRVCSSLGYELLEAKCQTVLSVRIWRLRWVHKLGG